MAALTVYNVNLELNSNKNAHNTSYYDSSDLILRRAQPFFITLTCNRALQSGDNITFIAQTGPRPSDSDGTRRVFDLSNSGSDSSSWSAVLQSSDSSTLSISISTTSDSIVGLYSLSAQIVSNGSSSSFTLGNFILLFNAWASGDDVYMSGAAERNEYVLNEAGLVFVGSATNFGSRGWDYGQFEQGILNIILKLQDSSIEYRRDAAADVARRNDPKYVSRVLSAMVNSNDDQGVVLGRWDGNYSDGVSPSAWNGSIALLRRWNSSGPVRYGQCWVFAGVLCTALRALGIPARMITNFESAHDTDRNLSVDQYFDKYGKSLGGADSVWNFHVWDECWFTRPDLGPNYNGWQIVDATPQEPSGGIFRLGPTSRRAVKEGDIDLVYDGPFVYSETNADRYEWIQYDDGTMKKVYSDTRSVGQYTSTKAVGSFGRVDVTNNYKYPEGSAEERQVYQKARGRLSRGAQFGSMSSSHTSLQSRVQTVGAVKPTFSGKFEVVGALEVGKDVNLNLILKNEASDSKTVKVAINATAIVYTNKPVNEILNTSQSVSLGPNEEKAASLKITYAQYDRLLTEDNMIKMSAVCQDDKQGELLVTETLTLKSPPLLIKFIGQHVEGKPLMVDIQFANPLKVEVKDCVLVVEGSGLLREPLEVKTPSLRPNQRSRIQFDIIPYRPNVRQLLCNLSSNLFTNIKGGQDLNVAAH
ncbi:protein-glutamine gamma-glutamyltransferase E-like [Microcaecilia unicolor]|uniref:protein-glutamine gamma-glutamyltransferase n=1 Tax=Microcaecilia unicolor TaxID=1415580 RepID=A0A6P7YYR8_9AMPH|nr:protein-glutamine gamma-glutamyltransferase E-like [Microcaecilia unicolor]